MRWSRVLVLGLMVGAFVMGCPIADPQVGRLEVNNELRQACWWLSDAEIQTQLAIIEADRQYGWSYVAESRIAYEACVEYGGLVAPECIECSAALITQVYGM
jgi:hypothetical protein